MSTLKGQNRDVYYEKVIKAVSVHTGTESTLKSAASIGKEIRKGMEKFKQISAL